MAGTNFNMMAPPIPAYVGSAQQAPRLIDDPTIGYFDNGGYGVIDYTAQKIVNARDIQWGGVSWQLLASCVGYASQSAVTKMAEIRAAGVERVSSLDFLEMQWLMFNLTSLSELSSSSIAAVAGCCTAAAKNIR